MSSRNASRPPALSRLRLAQLEDAPSVLKLLNESMAKNFRIHGTADITYLFENCVLSIVQLNVNETIVGCAACKDYPLIPSVHPSGWEHYIWSKYKVVDLNARNTLFLHLLCWNPLYAREAVDSMLKSLFMHDPYLNYVAMTKTLLKYPLLVPGQSRSEASFKRVQAMERGIPGDQLPSLYLAERPEVSPRLGVRRAVEEDNDDIVPIIERQSMRLREMYGDFYISELIARHPESERVLLVCEHNESAVGVMCFNTEINYEALEESFELSPFAGLRHLGGKPSKDMTVIDSTYNLMDHSIHNLNESLTKINASNFNVDTIKTATKDVRSKVIWVTDDDDKESKTGSMLDSTAAHMAQLGPYNHLDVLNLLEGEDEEFEFDIVNIDIEWLRLPQMVSYDEVSYGPADYVNKILDGTRRESTAIEDKNLRDKLKKSCATSTEKLQEPIRYMGTPNAFLLELFAMHPDYDERYGFDILEVAFELFPNRDYCVLCLPSNHAAFPLLEHFTLVTPYSCRIRYINESLYVAHVNSVRGELRVRPGEAYDIPAVDTVLEHASRRQALLDLFTSSLTSRTLDSYVLLSQNEPIGVIVLGPLEDGTAIRTQYALEPEPRRAGTDAAILAGVMSPVFEPHSRWYMRDLLRQSKYTTLFWICRLIAKGDAHPGRNLMSLAGHMEPVRPRRSIPNITKCKELDKLFKDVATPFALWVLERPLTSVPKVNVNHSIVVVGASHTGLAFLETLIMGPTSRYLTFTNITLVSKNGLPSAPECLRAADLCVPRYGRYTDRYIKSVPFYYSLDVMTACLVGINRKKKCIYLKNGGVKFYDELVITCGKQFQHPDYLKESLEIVKEIEKGKPCERMLMDNPRYQPDRVPPPPCVPENMMLINSLLEANICMRKLLRMISEAHETSHGLSKDNKVVVYGDCIESYCCIAALLQLGLSAEMIAFVEPFPPDEPEALRVNCFNNETVDERVQKSLSELGILVYRNCQLSGLRKKNKQIIALRLMSPLHTFVVPCFALFYYGIKAIDICAFKAINECGLVYDGGVVVGPKFDTNDPHVHAAGTCVRYSRSLYATRKMHRFYASEDVGGALAKLFLRRLDPFVMGDPHIYSCPSDVIPRYSSSLLAFMKSSHLILSNQKILSLNKPKLRWQPVIKFESPIILFATLPGPLYYMKIRKPGPEIPMEVQSYLPHQGHTLITDKRGNYFWLQLNVLHCVDAVTCLSKKSFSPDVFAQLYGKNEAFFDKLLTRYQMKQIDDFFTYFMQPWMSALYQDNFDALIQDINDENVSILKNVCLCEAIISSTTLGNEDDLKPEGSKDSTGDEHAGTSKTEPSTCFGSPICGLGFQETQNLGTFRSVIERFVTRISSIQMPNEGKATDIPSECGQTKAIRSKVAAIWKAVGGPEKVMAHITRYLDANTVLNPHYALPKPEFQ